jgi:molybdate transport system substrate-binding protein
MSFRVAVVAVVIVAAVALHPSASQPTVELRVLTARAIATVLAEVGSEFERTNGYKLTIVSDLPSGIARHLASGKPADVVVSGSSSIDDWIKQGRLLADTRTEIARSAIGVEVRAGARKPDVSSVDAFKRALLDAKSIAYLEVGSGVHIDKVVQQLGIADAIKAKVTRPDTDIVSELVARGDVELGIVVITQIMTTPGVVLAGPLPAELQSHVTFTAGVAANSTSKAVARGLIEFLRSPTATAVMRKQGMEPVASRPDSSR